MLAGKDVYKRQVLGIVKEFSNKKLKKASKLNTAIAGLKTVTDGQLELILTLKSLSLETNK